VTFVAQRSECGRGLMRRVPVAWWAAGATKQAARERRSDRARMSGDGRLPPFLRQVPAAASCRERELADAPGSWPSVRPFDQSGARL